MNTNEVDEKDTLNTNQDGHEGIVNAEPATEMEMENKMPDLLAEFKKGNLPEDGLKKMVEMANGLIPQYK